MSPPHSPRPPLQDSRGGDAGRRRCSPAPSRRRQPARCHVPAAGSASCSGKRGRRGAQLEDQTTPAFPRGRARPLEAISNSPPLPHVCPSIAYTPPPPILLPLPMRAPLPSLRGPAEPWRTRVTRRRAAPARPQPPWIRPSRRPGRKLWSPLTFPPSDLIPLSALALAFTGFLIKPSLAPFKSPGRMAPCAAAHGCCHHPPPHPGCGCRCGESGGVGEGGGGCKGWRGAERFAEVSALQ